MNIMVLNGSPKGDLSVTLQYILFLQQKFPEHTLKVVNISERIIRLEKDPDYFFQVIDDIKHADAIIWAFPIYYLLVPAQYKRFIELLWEKGMMDVFHGKYAVALSSSIHFYDHTAHNYIQAVSEDLQVHYVGGYSVDMFDLVSSQKRKNFLYFFQDFFAAIMEKRKVTKLFSPIQSTDFVYKPHSSWQVIGTAARKIVLVTDSLEGPPNLQKMITSIRQIFAEQLEVVNLASLQIQGGCRGCLHCGYDNTCIYTDEYRDFFTSKVQTADILIFAGSIQDRYLSSRWKMFFDRSFFNNHIPVLAGKQVGFVLSGPLRQNANIRQALEGLYQVHSVNIVDFITDESADSLEIDALLQNFAKRLVHAAQHDYQKSTSFLGVGGKKVLRDHIYGRIRFPFRADHRFYSKHNLYDFPQKEIQTRLRNFLMALLVTIPALRKEIYRNRMKAEMIKPLQKVLNIKG